MMANEILTVEGLKAYYRMNYFGVQREVRAVR
jgi:peptide/nickel transport system ATP-binding protein